ncbi:hypothetical protein [Streptomyces sp. NPDC007991]|uniref:hypothetical protein n=1 Tax=Streptomyces sp. NPDC007991 TaxID=3364803 RepID=UPI0036E72223
MDTTDLVAQTLDALKPMRSCDKPNQQQLREADVRAKAAIASALDRIAGALEELAANTAPATTVEPAIHHNA